MFCSTDASKIGDWLNRSQMGSIDKSLTEISEHLEAEIQLKPKFTEIKRTIVRAL
ncbi:MAG: hypothetical protein KME01_14325 [Chroococcus sp. CMT-3BRIN-NPC107]|nr:hypothetical protein [Chroococcus sp. CMT-3BRIN-NPC107]